MALLELMFPLALVFLLLPSSSFFKEFSSEFTALEEDLGLVNFEKPDIWYRSFLLWALLRYYVRTPDANMRESLLVELRSPSQGLLLT